MMNDGTASGSPVVSLRELGKVIGGKAVLRDISADIEAGSIVGLLGKNGAGKTSLPTRLVRGRGARWRAALALALLVPLIACEGSKRPIPLAAHVDLEAIQGGWYIVATIPNHFEKGMVAPYDVYSLRANGDIQEEFSLRSGGFAAKLRHFTVRDTIVPGTHNASWRVHIFWPVSLPFLVLYTDPAYRYVMFGENDRSLGWVFSRTPTIDDADYHALLERFAALGYDTSRFRKVIQRPEQIGLPGFWNDGIQ